ncbi:MAG: hypothetical protein LBI69_02535 [Puniceicoccales bacterium]|jgi:hypothetical protein|nr:hypothetical protein [Puniceicoccales bacterium]
MPAIKDCDVREAMKDSICIIDLDDNIKTFIEMTVDYDRARRSAGESAFDEKAWIENCKALTYCPCTFGEKLFYLLTALVNIRKNRERIAKLANSADATSDSIQEEAKNLKDQIDNTLTTTRKKIIIKNDGETKYLLSNFNAEMRTLKENGNALEAKKKNSRGKGVIPEMERCEDYL